MLCVLGEKFLKIEMKKKYVTGFLFNDELDRVVLIHKNRPKWQSGMYNGVGGKIEIFETENPMLSNNWGMELAEWLLLNGINFVY